MLTSLNPAFETVTGWKCEDWLGKSFAPIIHPDDLATAIDLYKKVLAGETTTVEFRMESSASTSYCEFRSTPIVEGGEIKGVFGIGRDITERRRADALLAGEKQVLEMIAAGGSLTDVLELLARIVEGQSSGMKCSVLLVDHDGASLRHGAAPSLPEEYNRAVDGVVIGPNVGSVRHGRPSRKSS